MSLTATIFGMDSGARLVSLFASIILHAVVLISIPIPFGEMGSGPAESDSALHITVEHSKLSDHPSQQQSTQPAMAPTPPQPDEIELETIESTAQPIQDPPLAVVPSKKSEPMVIQAVIVTPTVARNPEPAKVKPIKVATLEKQPDSIKQKKEQPTKPAQPKALPLPAAASIPAPSTELKGTKARVKKPLQTATSGNSKRLSREYRSTLLRLIERNKYYPLRARRRGMEGKALVAFTIKRNGEIRNISLSRSSKQQLLDRAAIQTIRRLGMAPPLPGGINRSHWRFVVPISYNIR